MEDIYTIVDKAIDVAFEEQKFHLKFYDFMKSCKTTGIGAKEFNQSSTAKELTDLISDLSEYIKGGKDDEHQILREAYGHLGKPKARKIKDYFSEIFVDVVCITILLYHQQREKALLQECRKLKQSLTRCYLE